MNKKKTAKIARSARGGHSFHPQSTHYYLYFSKTSKKAGSLATKTFFQVREFLAKEVPIPPKKDFTEAISRIIPKTSSHQPIKAGEGRDDIKRIVKKSNEVLCEATTVFPFTLFPDTVTLDRRKLTITKRNFFMSSKVLSIQVEEILNVSSDVGPFFGSLNIAIRGLTSQDHFDISYLWRKDAIHLKHMIQGYVIALKDEIKTDHLSQKDLIAVLAELGHDTNPSRV